jgi:hypothetical protein
MAQHEPTGLLAPLWDGPGDHDGFGGDHNISPLMHEQSRGPWYGTALAGTAVGVLVVAAMATVISAALLVSRQPVSPTGAVVPTNPPTTAPPTTAPSIPSVSPPTTTQAPWTPPPPAITSSPVIQTPVPPPATASPPKPPQTNITRPPIVIGTPTRGRTAPPLEPYPHNDPPS